jgi:hypothetical protein
MRAPVKDFLSHWLTQSRRGMSIVRIRFPRPRKPVKQIPKPAGPIEPVVQRDDGLWSIGWHDDAAGPFETRTFAAAVAAKQERRYDRI